MGTLSRIRTVALVVGLGVGAVVVSPATAASAKPAEAADAVAISSTQSPEQVSAYWTPQRMAQATAPKLAEPTAEQLRRLATSVPASRKPAQVASGGVPRLSMTGAGATQLRPNAVGANLWGPHGVMPAQTIGKLFFTRDDGSSGYCTASVISADNFSTIWTAGHCVHAGGGGGWWSSR
jgi:hypothetical protein